MPTPHCVAVITFFSLQVVKVGYFTMRVWLYVARAS